MPRFKAPAPAPPTPAARRNLYGTAKTPGSSNIGKDLSLVAAFDDLVRNGAVLHAGAEKQFLKFVQNAQEWRKRWQYAEMERMRLNVIVNEKENELAGKDYKVV